MQSSKGVMLLQPDRIYSNWIGPSTFCLCSWLPSVCISFHSGRATSALHCYIPVPSFTSGYLTQPQNSCHGSKKLRHQFRVTSCALSRCHKRVVNLNVFRCLHYLFCIAPVVGNSVISSSPWLMPTGKIHFLLSSPSALQKTAKPPPPCPLLGWGQEGVFANHRHSKPQPTK